MWIKLILFWESLPSPLVWIKDKPTIIKLGFVSLLGLICVGFLKFEPNIYSIFDSNYWTLLISYITVTTIIALFILYIMKDALTTVSILLVCLTVGLRLWIILPIEHPTTKDTYTKHQTYVVYRENCEYCQVAHTPMLSAVNLYNATHIQPIEVVERSKTTPVAKSLDKKVNHNGVVYRELDKTLEVIYVQMTEQNAPVQPKVNEVYQIIKGVNR